MIRPTFAVAPGRFVPGLCLAAGFLLGPCDLARAQTVSEITPKDPPYRLAMTSSVFLGVNENDARSAMSVWISTLAKDLSIPVDSEPVMFEDIDAVARSSATDTIDAFALTTEEFSVLSGRIPFDSLAATEQRSRVTEDYVLLVRQESAVFRLDELRGQRLVVLTTSRTSLAIIWLDTVLLQKGFPPAAEFFAPILSNSKPSRVVLPVFFKQADACLITRRSFEVMAEQNPQLGKQLRVLASSPGLIPLLFAFRADRRSAYRDKIVEGMKNLKASEAGRQILNFVQAGGVVELPASDLTETLDLIALHRSLLSAFSSTHPSHSSVVSSDRSVRDE